MDRLDNKNDKSMKSQFKGDKRTILRSEKMKVYELMKNLSSLPSGARVEFRALVSLEDVSRSEMNEEGDYLMNFEIQEVSSVNDTLVALFN